jgi:hypothetical protein
LNHEGHEFTRWMPMNPATYVIRREPEAILSPDRRVEMSVEISLSVAKFLGFPQNTRVYDGFPTSQQRVRVQTGQGFWCRPMRL